jgi:DNA-binding NtrC family response regulator
VDVRIVAATRRGISADQGDQGLRLDLAARLGPEAIRIPNLRARIEDVGTLVWHFLGKRPKPFTSEAFAALFLHDWPGNVRELEKVVSVAAVMSENDDQIGLEHLSESIAERAVRADESGPISTADEPTKPVPSREELEGLLRRFDGDVARVARQLGRQRTLVWRWLKKHGCDPARYRDSN